MVVLANPNSPTGTIIDHHLLKKIIAETNKREIPIVIDEAYYGFYKFTCINYLKRYKNLIILRTFSKAKWISRFKSRLYHKWEKKFPKIYSNIDLGMKLIQFNVSY